MVKFFRGFQALISDSSREDIASFTYHKTGTPMALKNETTHLRHGPSDCQWRALSSIVSDIQGLRDRRPSDDDNRAFFRRMKACRRLAFRCEKLACAYMGFFWLFAAMQWIKYL
jgi:hypothetical protein